jgi:hypothetical protein
MLYWESKHTRVRELRLFFEVLVKVGVLLGLAVLLAIVWVISFLVFHIAGLLIHVLLLLAVVFLILQLFSGRKI